MSIHPLAALDDEQRRSLLAYYREQEKAQPPALRIKASELQGGILLVVNYTDEYNEKVKPADWDWRMELARGCVLFERAGCAPVVVVQAMPKFHDYEQVPEAASHIDADGPLTIMRKHDGSCISLACFKGEVLLFTRGAQHNLQTELARELLREDTVSALKQMEGRTFALELIHEKDPKVEQTRGPNRLVLLYAVEAVAAGGSIVPVAELGSISGSLGLECVACEAATGTELKRRIQALNGAATMEDLREGFVVELSGHKYKVKPKIYKSVAGRPPPSVAWLSKCFLKKQKLDEVREEVDAMQKAPLNFGTLARELFEQHLASVDETIVRLRSLVATFPGPKELNQSDAVSRAEKNVLFPCVKLPVDQRDAWFDGAPRRFAIAQSLAKSAEGEAKADGKDKKQSKRKAEGSAEGSSTKKSKRDVADS